MITVVPKERLNTFGHRGFSNTWNMTELKKAMVGERSDNGAASTWAMSAEVGDEWENAANKITRIK